MAFNLNTKMFVIHISVIKTKSKVLIDFLSEITIPIEYFHYADIFLPKFVAKLPEHSNINCAIKLKENKLLFCSLIYSKEQIKLKISKTYIKTNLLNGFI